MTRYHPTSVYRNKPGRPPNTTTKTTTVRIDHDVIYDEYDTSFIKKYAKRIPFKVISMSIRRSTGNNTHVKVVVEGILSPLDELMVRAVFHDDARRIRGDLERYLTNSPVFGLLFDEKYYPLSGELVKAGDWVKV